MNLEQFTKKTLKDISIKATELFDRNFEQGGFFGKKWQARKANKDAGRGVLQKSGALRRGLQAPVQQDNKLVWRLSVPYAKVHNEGGTIATTQNVKPFTRTVKGKSQKVRSFSIKVNIKMPQRQFIGDHPKLRQEIEGIIQRNATKLLESFKNNLRK